MTAAVRLPCPGAEHPHPANVALRLERLAAEHGPRAAIVTAQGAAVTFAELEERVARFAAGLAARGLGPGDRVLLLMPMSVPLYVALLGLFRAGCTAVLLDPSAPYAGALLARLGLKGFIGSRKAHLLRLTTPALRGLSVYVSDGALPFGAEPLAAIAAPRLPAAEVSADAPALLTFTTGSSGTPKALARSHGFLQTQQQLLAHHLQLGPTDVDLPTLPVFLLSSLACGATCVLPDADLRRVASVDPAKVVAQLQRHGCTTLSGSPAFLEPVARYADAHGVRLPSLRRIYTGGAPVPPALLGTLRQLAPAAHVAVLYGASEAEPIALISADDAVRTLADERAGRGRCVGHPVPELRVRILDGTRPQPAGAIGELAVAGPHVSRAYFEDPEADARHKLRDGEGCVWHRTGDAGYLDPEGRLWLVGRIGEDVAGRYPLSVEPAAEQYPWVRRAALVGRDGAAVLACEVVEPPAGWEELLRRETRVDAVVRVRAVPLDPRHNAKIDRRRLRAQLAKAAA